MDLEEIRKKINLIDMEIWKLISERMELAMWANKFKPINEKAKKEDDIKDTVHSYAQWLINPQFRERLVTEIISETKRLQDQGLRLITFQGEHGAYGEVAARTFEPNGVYIPCMEFNDVFEEVKNGLIDFGIVPVENSLEGAVTQVNDLLVETDLKIVDEINLPIHHCLLTLPETNYREIRVVYSHAQALAQCRGFLLRNKLEPRPFYDTAGAAKMILRERQKSAAAIASKLCAEIYDLEIIKENIEDHPSNFTRFVILAKVETKEKGNKCSIIFSTRHKAGALFKVLKIFADAGINLTRIESRPIRNDPGNYAFFLDFQGSNEDSKIIEVLKKVEEETVMFKFLGCYKEVAKE